jgi:hypothetical protein
MDITQINSAYEVQNFFEDIKRGEMFWSQRKFITIQIL